MYASAVKAVAFDLGDTLVEYEGLPPSWEAHYGEAIVELVRFAGGDMKVAQIRAGCEVLRRFNTRLNPRSVEVGFETICRELLAAIRVPYEGEIDGAATSFFSIFRQRLRCFPDAVERLGALRRSGVRIGVLTDAPYGMPRRLVLEDMEMAGILGLVDEVVTSVDAGVRKPNPAGLELLASRLQVGPSEILFVGNEKKDVEVALAFGCEAVLVDRKSAMPEWRQQRTISSLAEL